MRIQDVTTTARRTHLTLLGRAWRCLCILALACACCLAQVSPAVAEGGASDAAPLADGTYLVDVALEGGTGRASVTSPAEVAVSGGVMEATIEWSSPNYDYMVVNGEQYLPQNSEGNSVFRIPLAAMDAPVEVVADTTAMSVPHEIRYTLTFDSGSAQRIEQRLPVAVLAAVAAGVGLGVYVVRRRQGGAAA